MKQLLFLCILFLWHDHATSQDPDFPHTELEWFTLESEHFLVHYHRGTERSAREVSDIAEKIYGPITQMYGHKPDQRVSIVIRDHDDYSNGAAYFYDNKIEIWSSPLDFELRGTHPWLLNVVSHEFTHIVQIQTTMKWGRRMPGVYLQWLGYEAERRPDVLYGFPNVIVSYPLSGFIVPSWFAEGVAQFNHPDFKYDYWDSHRDMILRMYMLDGNPLTWEEMAVFGKTSLGNESSYNAGFSIVKYIAETYGADKLKEISERLSTTFRATIDGAIEDVLGKSGDELYDEWKKSKTDQYGKMRERMGDSLCEGKIIENEGFGNFYPQFTPDGSGLAYVSNKGRDYFGQSSVYLHDLQSGRSREIVASVRSSLSFSPDGRYLYYSRATRDNPHWSKFYDVYRYDMARKKETRLTTGLRAQNPKVSHDGTTIVFAFENDGTINLGMVDSLGKNFRQITHFRDGEQAFTPAWSPDGKTVAFGFSDGQRQSLAAIDSDGADFRIIRGGDSRNPSYSQDGNVLYYSSDKGGIFNVFALTMDTDKEEQVTRVIGGAFLPTVNKEGDVAYANYTSSGYKIALLKKSTKETSAGDSVVALTNSFAGTDHQGSINDGPLVSAQTLQSAVSGKGPRPYRNVFTSLSLIPFVRFDNYNQGSSGFDIVKPGLYFVSGDVLDKLGIFGGAAINRKLERDLFLIFEYRDRLPLFYQLGLEPVASLELYNITRKRESSFDLPPSPAPIGVEVTYNLLEFDVSLSQAIFDEYDDARMTYSLSRYSADIGSFVNPNTGSVNPAFNNAYFIGNSFSLLWKHHGLVPSVDRDINPTGRTLSLKYSLELNKFNPEGHYDFSSGIPRAVYTDIDFHRLEFSWDEHIPMPIDKHTLSIGVNAGTILRDTVDSFFDFYIGGFAAMRGYPFYGVGGNSYARSQVVYRFPVSTSLNFRFLQFYFTKLFASVFGDFGDAWTGSAPSLGQWKRDVGVELRLESFSFYAYPTRIFFSGAYGLDRYTTNFNGVDVTYGKEWRFYLGVLFGFELNELGKTGKMVQP